MSYSSICSLWESGVHGEMRMDGWPRRRAGKLKRDWRAGRCANSLLRLIYIVKAKAF